MRLSIIRRVTPSQPLSEQGSKKVLTAHVRSAIPAPFIGLCTHPYRVSLLQSVADVNGATKRALYDAYLAGTNRPVLVTLSQSMI